MLCCHRIEADADAHVRQYLVLQPLSLKGQIRTDWLLVVLPPTQGQGKYAPMDYMHLIPSSSLNMVHFTTCQ